MQVLDLFATILQSAAEINDFVTCTKFTASNAVGSTFGDMYAQQMKVKRMVSSFVDVPNGKGLWSKCQMANVGCRKDV